MKSVSSLPELRVPHLAPEQRKMSPDRLQSGAPLTWLSLLTELGETEAQGWSQLAHGAVEPSPGCQPDRPLSL